MPQAYWLNQMIAELDRKGLHPNQNGTSIELTNSGNDDIMLVYVCERSSSQDVTHHLLIQNIDGVSIIERFSYNQHIGANLDSYLQHRVMTVKVLTPHLLGDMDLSGVESFLEE